MTDNELRRLSRMELTQLLLEVTKENEILQDENAALKSRLEDKNIIMDRVGNIAEASLALSRTFQDAQDAADLYLENAKRAYAERVGRQIRRLSDGLAEIAEENLRLFRQMKEQAEEAAGRVGGQEPDGKEAGEESAQGRTRDDGG